MKDKAAVGGAGVAVGWLASSSSKVSPEQLAAMVVWLDKSFGSVGFVSFFFNIVFIGAMGYMLQYFSNKDDQKRGDVMALVARVEKIVDSSHANMDRFREALHNLQLAFAKGGFNVRNSTENPAANTGK